MSELPWYKEGLKFKCTECGKCCTGQAGYTWVTEEEILPMAHFLNCSVKDFKIKYIRRRDNRMALIEQKIGDGEYKCVFLKGKRCEIYPVRPQQCQTFPWWPENLRSEESWKSAALLCEGINQAAPVVSYCDIESSVSDSEPTVLK